MDVRSFLMTRGVDLKTVDKFCEYHKQNPHIWKEFEGRALKLIEMGINRFGAKCIMEAIRYDTTVESKGEYKISNSFTAYYARVFAWKYPQHEGFFEERDVKGLHSKYEGEVCQSNHR